MSVPKSLVSIVESVIGNTDELYPLHEPFFGGNEWKYVKECLDSGWVSSVGFYVDLFEQKLAEKCGVTYAIPTVNGTSALHISLLLAGVEKGDEVLLPTLTFIATANAVSYCKAIPHFIDCTRDTLGIDCNKLSKYLEENTESRDGYIYNKKTGRRISIIVPVHIFGHSADMDELQQLSQNYNLQIVEDAAESLGSLYKGKPLGSFGMVAALSFNGNKIVTTGGGGAILTNNKELAKRAKHVTSTAKQPHAWESIHDEIGYNYRMPNINAALGCAQLEFLDSFVQAKRVLASKYQQAFTDSEEYDFLVEPDYNQSNYWLNAICLKTDRKRDELLEQLNKKGYLCRPIWKLMHHLDMYKDCPRMDLSVSEDLEDKVINLPSSVKLGKQS